MRELQNFSQFVKRLSADYGFVLCGIAKAETLDQYASNNLDQWVENGKNAAMDWFNRNEEIRKNPTMLIENGKSIIVMGYAYSPIVPNIEEPNIASYAHDIDYHFTLKDKLKQIISEIKKEYGSDITAREFVDSAPIMERYWAVKAGLGWIGKNSILINRKFGSYILLCEIVTNAVSDIYDSEDSFNGCGRCNKCISMCPTGAIEATGIDARLCSSYLTIEHRGDFTNNQIETIRKSSIHWVYGCDTCLLCCPWNKKIIESRAVIPKYIVNSELLSNFKNITKGTPLQRSGRKTLIRNICAFSDTERYTLNNIDNVFVSEATTFYNDVLSDSK